ncbi:hypothetical protein PROFUN_15775 [Planoprotostelium fungivorum]|uniref:Uncharacterized protein n=1 Tax=Planoprotostelium fungivorum TaxID=1890364 RepID=A0A2P6MQ11_9EUKA|nr:hypothetical protein PROFUN_15775 [Planoprotostelium fungivorum]
MIPSTTPNDFGRLDQSGHQMIISALQSGGLGKYLSSQVTAFADLYQISTIL